MTNDLWTFGTGILLTLVSSFAVMFYIRPHLHKVLVDLCGTQERAGFWTAFSSVTLVLMPMICAMHYRPEVTFGADPCFAIIDQLKWALIGLVGTVIILGVVISRFIPGTTFPIGPSNVPRV
jgi:hypothetical protein